MKTDQPLRAPALVVGCGYLGLRVARRWLAADRPVYAVTRRPERAAELATLGIRPIVADVTQPATLQALPAVQTVLYAVGWDRQSGLPALRVYALGFIEVLDRLMALDPRPECVLFVSSTGVYGSGLNQRVTESSPCLPERPAGAALAAAEAALRRHWLGRHAIILRLAGLYGPGRLPALADLVAGNPLPASPEALLNLIHVEDAAEAILAAEARGRRPGLYNIADGHPVARGEFYRHLANLLGCQPPTFRPGNEGGRRNRSGGKHVDNHRMLSELQLRLAYPTYREGLASIVAHMRHQGP